MKKKNVIQRRQVADEGKDFNEVYEEFQTENKARGLSENTISFYYNNLIALRRFLEDVGKDDDISKLTKEVYNQYAVFLREKYENETTINTYQRAARTFLYFAMSEGYITPPYKIRLESPEEKIVDTYTDDDIKKLLKKPNLKTCHFSEYRNWVLVQYLLDTGNRLRTVINIQVKDVDLEAGMVAIRKVKNKRQQFNPISRPLVKTIRKYLNTWGLEKDDYLFPSVDRGQLTKHAIQKTIRRYNESRGVDKFSIHAFRHTFAKNYIQTGGNAFKLQRLLGHSTLEVTRTYIALFGDDLAADFDKHSLVERHTTKGKRIQRQV